jgi:hypothetical protein
MAAAEIKRVGDIQIEQDLEQLRREWRWQRFGWTVMLLLALAGLLGVFGNGLLAKASHGGDADPLRLEYERFARHGAPTELTITISPQAVENGKARLWIERDYLQAVAVESIVPEPEKSEAVVHNGEPALQYTFPVAEASSPASIRFQIRPDERGRRHGSVGVPHQEPIRFSQFVFP